MRINLLLANAIALGLVANIATANTYQTEVNAGFNLINYDDYRPPFEDARKSENWQASATYHFKAVNPAGRPRAEAAFLEKSSNFTLGYENDQLFYRSDMVAYWYTSATTISPMRVVDFTHRLAFADIEFYLPDGVFYLGGHIQEGHYETMFKDQQGVEWTTPHTTKTVWDLRLGLTPVTGLLVWTELVEDQDFDKEWNVNAKYVTDLGGNTINLEGSYNNAEYADIASVAADYYLDHSFSIGLAYEHYKGNFRDDFYGLRTRKFFTENLALNADYTRSDHADSYNLGITYRF